MPTPHTGAWGTWDFGITEKIGDWLGKGRTDQGGSEIFVTQGSSNLENPQSDAARQSSGQVLGSTDIAPNQSIQNYTPAPAPTNDTKKPSGSPSGSSSGGAKPNPWTTYINVPGRGTMKLQDAIGEGLVNEYGQPVGGDNNQGDLSKQISDLYAPALQAADEQAGVVRSGYEGDVKNLQNRVAQALSQYNTQGEQLLQDTDTEQSSFNKVIESALNQAVRAYNALNQRANVFYGGATGTGRAMNELAQREYYRQQGQIGSKQAEGTQQFSQERGRIRQYIDSKVKDLDLYKQEALDSLKQNLDAQIASINARKGEIEANKTRDKISVLQDAINRTRAIQDQDKTFRQNLALAGVQQMQEIAGRAFTPQEIKAYISEFTSDLNIVPGQQQTAESLVASLQTKPKTYEDEFAKLNPNAAQQTQTKSSPTVGPMSTPYGPYIPEGYDQRGNYVGYTA